VYGRTQHINFFDLGLERFLVDLPGYGYAEVPEAVRAHWVELLGRYLGERSSLIGLLLIMDARHPLKDLDRRMLDYFTPTGRPVHILLSKADKLSRQEQATTLRNRHRVCHSRTKLLRQRCIQSLCCQQTDDQSQNRSQLTDKAFHKARHHTGTYYNKDNYINRCHYLFLKEKGGTEL
jgi:ribosome biogenesis GTP-binding protein YsxC/EngB